MEKESQPESISTVTIKPDYAPSEVYSSEPPPAYHKPQSSAVQVAKIVAVTVVLVSVVLGSFILASAYVTANASCRQLEQELELLSEAADRFQPPPQPEALIQVIAGYYLDSLKMVGGCPKSMRCDMGTENTVVETFQKELHELFNPSPSTKPPFLYGKSCHNQRIESWWGILRKHNAQFWMNLFQMLKDDDLFDGSFLDKSLIQYCFMDLVQEEPLALKRQADPLQAEESHSNAKEIENNNIENDSESSSDSSDGSSDSSQSSESEEEERTPIHFKLPLQLDFDDLAGALIEKNQKSRMNCIVEKKRAEEVVDHQPKTVRLPFGVNLTTDPRYERLSGERMIIVCESGHMQRAQPPPQPQPEEDQEDTIMIQPVMIPIPHTPFQTHMPQQMQPIMQQEQQPMRPPMNVMHPMETMRPPMPPMMQAQVQMQPQPQPQQHNEFPPNPILQHIVQQIIAQKIMESEKARDEQQQQQQQQQIQQQQRQQEQPQPQEMHAEVEQRPQHRFHVPQNMIGRTFPIPEEVLTQLNRLPNRDVIVAVSEPDSDENSQEVRFVQQQRQNAAEMNGRQAFSRGLPVHIPVSMMPNEPEQEQEPQQVASDEPRPHYVQPRSVRSVDALLGKNEKRVKRCACDCAC